MKRGTAVAPEMHTASHAVARTGHRCEQATEQAALAQGVQGITGHTVGPGVFLPQRASH
eukprot:CAMPEP_0119381256 /NCGR_PEP_ID=MMETSP1334-20130426/62547_1 /TAXON_ID=127549 /ORGANISM="Calcidiscus leptoporus, Strain RCC1130" /LENGTH=58 /DNA_ID=CAMNT_0007401323 /DNA_START=61 /DNA_END=234 /DNA_ORIENTATION=+